MPLFCVFKKGDVDASKVQTIYFTLTKVALKAAT